MWIQLLEGIPAKEAELLELVKEKVLVQESYKRTCTKDPFRTYKLNKY